MRIPVCLAFFFAVTNSASVVTVDRCNLDYACQNYTTARLCDKQAECKSTYWCRTVLDEELCSACKVEVEKVQKWFEQKKTKDEIYNELMKFCKDIPETQLQNDCQDLVATNFNSVYDDIIGFVDPSTLCTAIKLCNAVSVEEYAAHAMEILPDMLKKALKEKKKIPIAAPFEVKNEEFDDLCSDCETFMKNLQTAVLREKNALMKFVEDTKLECETFGSEADVCKEHVDFFVSHAASLVAQNEDSKSVCKKMKLCKPFQQKVVGDMCADCKTFFKEWQELLKSNQTILDSLVEAASTFYCMQKPVELRRQCVRYVSMVIKVLIEQMEREDVGKICRKLQLCDPQPQVETVDLTLIQGQIVPDFHDQQPNGDHCTDCKNFIGDVQNVITNNASLVQELVDLVKQECSELGPELEPVCADFIEANWKHYAQIIENADVDTICTTIEMCSAQALPNGDKHPVPVEGNICDDCVAFFGDWKDIIANNKSVIDPSDICATLYFCDADKSQWLENLRTKFEALKNKKEKDDVECELCKLVIEEVEKLIEGNRTEEAIEDALVKVCETIDEKLKEECKAFIDQYGPTVIDLLIKELDSLEICSKLSLCPKSEKLGNFKDEKQPNGDHCTDCKNFIGDVQNVITNNASLVQELIDLVKQECSELGPELEPTCKGLVEANWKHYSQIFANTDVDTICTTIEMCTSQALLAGKVPSRVNGDLCNDCVAFFGDWQDIITNNKSVITTFEKRIKEIACRNVPIVQHLECELFIDKYASEIINYMKKDPQTICSTLYFCDAHKSQRLENVPAKMEELEDEPDQVKVNPECGACQYVVEEVEKLIGENRTEESIVAALEQVCEVVGEKLEPECKDFVEKYGPNLIELLIQELSSLEVCTKLGLCPPSLEHDKKENEKVDIGIVCTICQVIVREIAKKVNINSTKASIVAGMYKACAILPRTLESKCTSFVKRNGDKIAYLILKFSLNPTIVCYAVGACSPFAKMKQELEKHSNGDHCTDCKNFIGDVQNVINNNASLVQELVDLVEQECSQLGPGLQGICEGYVKNNWKKITQMIAKADVDTICTTIEMCPAQTQREDNLPARVTGNICDDCEAFFGDWQDIIMNNKSVIDPSAICAAIYFCDAHKSQWLEDLRAELKALKSGNEKDDATCEFCQFGIEEIEKLIEGNRTEENIEKALQEVCKLYGEDIREQCEEFMIKYGPAVIDFLIQEMNSLEICAKLGLCPETERQETAEEEKGDNSVSCTICVFVVDTLEKMIDTNSTEEEIVSALERVCSLIPSSMAAECDEFVVQYGAQIVEILVKTILRPHEVCSVLGLCLAESPSVDSMKVDNTVSCDICKVVAGELETLLDNNRTKASIVAALEEVCSLLPSQKKDKCDQLVNQYGAVIIEVLVKALLSPRQICSILQLCSSSTNSKGFANLNEGTINGCDICKFTVTEVDKILGDTTVQDTIVNAMLGLCSHLGRYSTGCQGIVGQYAKSIIQLISEEIEPVRDCTLVGMCRNGVQDEPLNNLECDICNAVSGYLQAELENPTIAKDVEVALDKVCSSLPKKSQDACADLIKTYAETIVELLVEETSPSLLCKELRVCTAGTKKEVKDVSKGLECEICTEISNKIDQALKKDSTKVGSGVSCTVCNVIMQELHNILTESGTEEKIKEALKTACGLIPGNLKTDCTTLVDTYTADLVALLIQELVPQQICHNLKLCDAPVEVKKVSSEATCEICKLVAGGLDELLAENATEAEIEKALDEVCSILPGSVSSECTDFVEQYTSVIVELLVEEMNPSKICSELNLCSSGKVAVKKVSSDITCEVCKDVAAEIETLLANNATEEEIEQTLEKLCDKLPSKQAEECVKFVKEYAQTIINLLAEEMEPDKICSELKLCTQAVVQEVKTEQISSTDECELCKQFVQKLDNALSDDRTEEEILKVMDLVCFLAPGDRRKQCDDFMKEYRDKLIKFLLAELSPDKICREIHLCTTSSPAIKAEQISSTDECELCKQFVQKLDNALSDDRTEEEILKVMDIVCFLAPGDQRKQCDDFMKEYRDKLIKFLLAELSPDKICREIHLCTSSSPAIKLSSEIECKMCDAITGYLERNLNQLSTENEILDTVKKVCSVALDKGDHAVCMEYISDYGPGVVSILVNEFVPDKVCPALHACPAKKPPQPVKKLQLFNTNKLCEECQFFIQVLDKILEDNATVDDVIKAAEQACKELPEEFVDLCDSEVEQYGPIIFKYIAKIGDPLFICEKLKLCPVSNDFFGYNPCNAGPTYWCSSMYAAKSCGAFEHCMRHVWN